MKGWVGLVGWPVADGLPTVVTRRLQAERRTESVRRPNTGVPPTVLRNQPQDMTEGLFVGLYRRCCTCWRCWAWLARLAMLWCCACLHVVKTNSSQQSTSSRWRSSTSSPVSSLYRSQSSWNTPTSASAQTPSARFFCSSSSELNNRNFLCCCCSSYHHHHQFNTHECSMNNKIHEKAHTILQKEVQKRYKKTNNTT